MNKGNNKSELIMFSVDGCPKCEAFSLIFCEKNIAYRRVNDPEELVRFGDENGIGDIPIFSVNGYAVSYHDMLKILKITESEWEKILKKVE